MQERDGCTAPGACGSSRPSVSGSALRAVHSSTVLHPSDANEASALVAAMGDTTGISFIRTLRGNTPVRTPADEPVRIGGSRIVRCADADDVAIVAGDVTVDEAENAADAPQQEGTRARDRLLLDQADRRRDAADRGARRGEIVTVRDQWPEGGLGDAVLEALADADGRPPMTKLGVRSMPVSGTPAELMHEAGIDAELITATARELAGARVLPD